MPIWRRNANLPVTKVEISKGTTSEHQESRIYIIVGFLAVANGATSI